MEIFNSKAFTTTGTSFIDYLNESQPELLPNSRLTANRESFDTATLPHATTVVALTYAQGVIMAGDRRATAGLSIAHRHMDKVLRADEHSGIAIAGTAGIAMDLVRLFQVQLEHYEKMAGDPLSFEGKANQLSFMIRNNLPLAMQGLLVVPLFAGYDTLREAGRVFSYDATGGRYEEFKYAATGSGSVHAKNWIKADFKDDLDQDSAINIAIRSLFAAADEDAGTGGPDLVRKIFPSVAVINAEGFSYLEDDQVEAKAIELLAGPEQGGDE
ncbi:MAG: proteasome subunit beta [Acidimicrobiia bacterium]